ncbi:MAG: elongation factor G [candidate division WOR-3 bacterium]|nr:elongation factor G [candidate division WOR-3 bacterium]
MTTDTKMIRNIAFTGHSSSGKTTLGEAVLFNAGKTNRLGRVDEKNSVLDHGDEEISRQITISLSMASLDWKDRHINVLDTPGFPDFFGEVVSAARVVEALAIVIDSTSGIELGTEKAWDLVKKKDLAAMFIINKMTKENADYEAVLADIKSMFTKNATMIQLPIGQGPEFKGVVNLLTGKAYSFNEGKSEETEVPGDIKDKAESMKEELIEMIAQSDDKLMEKFFEDGLSDEDIEIGFQKAIKQGKLYPVLFTDAYENIGVANVMDIIANIMPSPAINQEYEILDDEDNEQTIAIDDKFTGFVFKTAVEKHIGDMAYVRVFTGTLETGTDADNPKKRSSEKINQMYSLVGKERTDISEAPAGSIAALVKLKNTKTNDTLCDSSLNLHYKEIEFPHANVSMAIIPQAKGDEEKISNGLTKLSEEDPSFVFNFDSEIKQTLVHGLGTIHLEVIIKKLKEKFGVNVDLVKPKIKYRETITKPAAAEGKHKKQSGGRGQFGVCNVKFEPNAEEEEFQFVDEIFGGSIPSKFVPSVEKGVRQQLKEGYLAGYPMVNIKATVYDGKFHPVDSSDIAFQLAGSNAVKNAMPNAGVVLLEPIMKVSVIVPEEYMGDIMGDMNSRRGRILGMEAKGRNQKVNALVPQAEMYQYSSQLRSMTQGRGTFAMEFEKYDKVPTDQAKKIVEEAKAEDEDE